MINRIFVLFLILPFLNSCGESGGEVGCLGTLSCTEELRLLNVELKDLDNQPVALDSVYSIHESAGVYYFNPSDFGSGTEGTYTLWTDVEMDLVERKGSQIIFEGWQENRKVVSEVFTVGHDCCHIELLDGETLIIVE